MRETMWGLALPERPAPRERVSFWLAISVGIGVVSGAVAVAAGIRAWSGVGLLVGGVLVAVGIVSPRLTARAYRAWDRLARAYGGWAQRMILRLCYVTLFGAAGLGRSRLCLSRREAGGTTWMARETLPPPAYRNQDESSARAVTTRGWISATMEWARRAGEWWAIWLIPYLALMRLLDAALGPQAGGEEPPRGIYTLY
jgi:uncharacterized membrane protein